jgi:hypothetical protein
MMTKRYVFLGISAALLAGAAGCAKARSDHAGQGEEAEKETFGRLTIDELEARMADAKAGKVKLAIFDNNDHDRFDKGHIPGAKWVKFNDVKAGDLPADKDTTLVFYCSNEL